jgi:hypothetical protein
MYQQIERKNAEVYIDNTKFITHQSASSNKEEASLVSAEKYLIVLKGAYKKKEIIFNSRSVCNKTYKKQINRNDRNKTKD